jgi:5-methylcytosine-specific restriction endonuclease McrA
MNRTAINKKANAEILKQAKALGIMRCEICGSSNWLTRMHRHKRKWYYDKPDDWLWRIDQWLIACMSCHEKYEKDKKATEILFIKKRDNDETYKNKLKRETI